MEVQVDHEGSPWAGVANAVRTCEDLQSRAPPRIPRIRERECRDTLGNMLRDHQLAGKALVVIGVAIRRDKDLRLCRTVNCFSTSISGTGPNSSPKQVTTTIQFDQQLQGTRNIPPGPVRPCPQSSGSQLRRFLSTVICGGGRSVIGSACKRP